MDVLRHELRVGPSCSLWNRNALGSSDRRILKNGNPPHRHPNTTMLCRLNATGSPRGPHNITLWLV
jgi:hypothetical protein